jgi:ABC-type phosphate/phosphonate transport system substrate-binding protein
MTEQRGKSMKRMIMPAVAAMTAVVWVLAGSRSGADQPRSCEPVNIGMVQTLFVDIPSPIVAVLAHPFGNLMKDQTGVDGKLVIEGDAFHVGKALHEDKLQLGIFQGIEFAWAHQKFSDLEPLMIAISKHRTLHANLVTSQTNNAANFAAFRGKDVAIPQRSKEHLRQFLKHGCQECGVNNPETFFNQVLRPTSTEDALDDVVSGTVQAAVVDTLDLETYKDIKPGCFRRLRIVQISEPFPTGVIAVHRGALDSAILQKFRTGMSNAHNNLKARELMAMFQLTAFEPVPADYEQVLTNILRSYPPPESPAAKTASKR